MKIALLIKESFNYSIDLYLSGVHKKHLNKSFLFLLYSLLLGLIIYLSACYMWHLFFESSTEQFFDLLPLYLTQIYENGNGLIFLFLFGFIWPVVLKNPYSMDEKFKDLAFKFPDGYMNKWGQFVFIMFIITLLTIKNPLQLLFGIEEDSTTSLTFLLNEYSADNHTWIGRLINWGDKIIYLILLYIGIIFTGIIFLKKEGKKVFRVELLVCVINYFLLDSIIHNINWILTQYVDPFIGIPFDGTGWYKLFTLFVKLYIINYFLLGLIAFTFYPIKKILLEKSDNISL